MSKRCHITGILLSLCLWWCAADAWAWNPLVVSGRCRQSGVSCSSTIGNAGQRQGACCDPSDANVALCNNNNACVGGRPYLWKDATVPILWWFNPNDMAQKAGFSRYSEGQLEAAFKRAWDAWKAPSCTSFEHKYQGKTTSRLSTSDQRLVLYLPDPKEWAELGQGSSTLAFTRPIANDKGELRDADIAFNPLGARGWLISPPSGLDLVRVAAHEIGHAVGLAHTHLSEALMFYANQPIPFRGLDSDDVDAICFSYPKRTCQSDTDCGGCWRCQGSECIRRSIPEAKGLCQPCEKPSDCGGLRDICMRFPQGNRCVQACDANGCCPNGYRCADIGLNQFMCLPDAGVCPDVKCTQDSQCGPGEMCEKGTCKPRPVEVHPRTCSACQDDKGCLNGFRCVSFPDGNGRCMQPCAAENFCPDGFRCGLQNGARVCLPNDWICPCAKNEQCAKGEVCRDGYCRPEKCQFGCLCSDKAFCPPGFQCAQGADTRLCVQICGEDASFAPGKPGATCRQDKSCDDGASCIVVEGLGPVCLLGCKDDQECRSKGGYCYVFRGKSYCMCREDGECLDGQRCNRSVLGRAKAGACATQRPFELACSPDYSCLDAGASKLCLPRSNNPWEPCDDLRACGRGLLCVLTSTSARSGICLENCTTTNTCSRGGSCVLSGGSDTKLCGCSNQNPCPSNYRCQLISGGAGFCVLQQPDVCGNGRCESIRGETCGTCPKDCQCPGGQRCEQDLCVLPPSTKGDAGPPEGRCASAQLAPNQNGELVCVPRQCGCQQGPSREPFWLLALLCLFIVLRRSHARAKVK